MIAPFTDSELYSQLMSPCYFQTRTCLISWTANNVCSASLIFQHFVIALVLKNPFAITMFVLDSGIRKQLYAQGKIHIMLLSWDGLDQR